MTSKENENLMNQAQMYQQQMQNVVTQKSTMAMEKRELEKAGKELDKNKGDTAYKAAGPILVKSGIEDIKKELKERVEFIDLKMKSIEKQEKMIREKLEEIRSKISPGQGK